MVGAAPGAAGPGRQGRAGRPARGRAVGAEGRDGGQGGAHPVRPCPRSALHEILMQHSRVAKPTEPRAQGQAGSSGVELDRAGLSCAELDQAGPSLAELGRASRGLAAPGIEGQPRAGWRGLATPLAPRPTPLMVGPCWRPRPHARTRGQPAGKPDYLPTAIAPGYKATREGRGSRGTSENHARRASRQPF